MLGLEGGLIKTRMRGEKVINELIMCVYVHITDKMKQSILSRKTQFHANIFLSAGTCDTTNIQSIKLIKICRIKHTVYPPLDRV